jgi:heparanase
VAKIDERFQSYNVEMVEVTGGWFWKPYGAPKKPAAARPRAGGAIPAGMDPAMFEYRPPIDLAAPRLRKLAAALGPAFVRVSGTWANSVFFHDSDAPPPAEPPAGFGGILTRRQWKGVVDFAGAVDAEVITSFATSAGTRDAAGVWTADQAGRLVAFTKKIGGAITAAELMNEPTYAAMGGAPEGYDAAMFGRDVAAFRRFARQAAPEMLVQGPGAVGEGGPAPMTMGGGMLRTADLLSATGPAFDVFSYHVYGAASKRCASLGAALQTTADEALSEQWLSRASAITDFYAKLRDRFDPGKPLWITETADAACGGNPWAATFLDTFRYLDTHGALARRGVQVIAHNTLASSDYGLLDPDTFAPRPNYWAALLWARLMGPTVLDPGPPPDASVHLYAHCLRGRRGGVALLAINLDRRAAHDVALSTAATRYSLTAARLLDQAVRLNGRELRLGRGGDLPRTEGVAVAAGRVRLEPASITFLAVPGAANRACE